MDLAFVDPIGLGAFADVWLAEDTQLRRRVAVKFFRDTDPIVHRQVVLDHARALARVQHAAVVTVFGIENVRHPETGTECLAIVMEHVPGETLFKLARRLTSSSASKIAHDLAGAVEAIHNAGLVHDDLHDGNVIVSANGAKVLDILYTRSLADVGARTARTDRKNDLRSLSTLIRKVLEKTDGVTAAALVEAHFRASSAETARAVLEEYRAVLEDRLPLTGHPGTSQRDLGATSFKNSELYLVLVRGETGLNLETHVFVQSAPSSMKRILVLPVVMIATTNRIWEVRSFSRTVSLLADHVLGEPRTFDQELLYTDSDFSTAVIPDPMFVGAPDNITIPLATPEPQSMSRQHLFMLDRSLHLLGALGPYAFIQQDDYTFAGGAHGGCECAFRLIDLENLVAHTSPMAIMTKEECASLSARETAVAVAAFAAFHTERTFDEPPTKAAVELVAARPELQSSDEYGIVLKFACGTYYTASGGGWSSYTIAEEVNCHTSPAALEPFLRLPEALRTALGPHVDRSVGFSVASTRNGGRPLLESKLKDVAT